MRVRSNDLVNGDGAGPAPTSMTPRKLYERPFQRPRTASDGGFGSTPSGNDIVSAW
jgi:hypothetical protein